LGDTIYVCPNEEVEIFTQNGLSVSWSNGAVGNSVLVSESQWITASFQSEIGSTSYSDSVYVQVIPNPYYEIIGMDATCFGATNGSILVDSLHPSWELTNADLIELASGIYELQLVHTAGCIHFTNVEVGEPSLLEIQATPLQPLCNGEANGEIIIESISGGTQPYTTNLTDEFGNLISEQEFGYSNLTTGLYSLVVQDSMGCTTQMNFLINEPEILEVTIEQEGDNSPQHLINVFGGSAPYNIFINGILSKSQSVTLQEGDNLIYIEDENGCTVESSVNLQLINVPEVNAWMGRPPTIQELSALSLNNDWKVEVYNALGQQIDFDQIMHVPNHDKQVLFIVLSNRAMNVYHTFKLLMD
jgi:SprB repeat